MSPESLDERFVSTGSLPSPESVQPILDDTHRRFREDDSGACSTVYPALAAVAPDQFGLCLVGTNGTTFVAGDGDAPFTIMSVAKPFVMAVVVQAIGAEAVRARIGVNATGLAFNSIAALESRPDGRTNPMVNSGAIATTSLAPGSTGDEKWQFVLDGLSGFAGRALTLDQQVLESALATNHRNRAIAQLLADEGVLASTPDIAAEVYTKQSSLAVTARDLAVMGATLADGGVNPLTRERIVDVETCRTVLAVMATAGLYENSGDWLLDVGLPGKSGIGGGMVTVSPGKGALGSFAPRLDEAGNSVRGQLAAAHLSRRLGLDLFASLPASQAVT